MSLALYSSHADAENNSLLVIDKASAKKMSLRKRFKGTGIRGKQLASVGARHCLGVAQLQMRLSPAVAVRGGAGMAKLRPQGFLPETKGTAIAAGVSLTLWNNDTVQLDVNVNAVRVGYDSGTLADTTVMLALRNR